MYSCFGSGSSPGRLNSINNGRPPGIQKILSGYPVSPGVTSLEPMIPRCFHARSTASRSIFDSFMEAYEDHGKERRRHSPDVQTTHRKDHNHQVGQLVSWLPPHVSS